MLHTLATLAATLRIVRDKKRQIWRLAVPPFLLAMALKAWISVQQTGDVWPDLPSAAPLAYDLTVRGSLALALAVMGLLWHRAIYFGPRARLTPGLALRYWALGAMLCALAILPFVPLVWGIKAQFLPGAALHAAVFVADALSLGVVLIFGVVVARRAGGAVFAWRAAWTSAGVGSSAAIAVLLALVMQGQSVLVGAIVGVHGGAAFLLDGALTFALILTVLTLMVRPGHAHPVT
jgi:hypothetical protein